MSTHSVDGRPWAKLSQIKAGDTLIHDNGSSCFPKNKAVVVEKSEEGELFFRCRRGIHGLGSQLSDEDEDSMVGFWLSPQTLMDRLRGALQRIRDFPATDDPINDIETIRDLASNALEDYFPAQPPPTKEGT